MIGLLEPGEFVTARDGTLISPFLSPLDGSAANRGVHDAMGDVSIAAGRLEPGVSSLVHVHPVVSQTVYVRAGELTLRTRTPGSNSVVEREAHADQAAVIEPGTLLQLCNRGGDSVELLYIVAPAYVLQNGPDGEVVYDDAIVLPESWQALQAANYQVAALAYSRERILANREAARRSLFRVSKARGD